MTKFLAAVFGDQAAAAEGTALGGFIYAPAMESGVPVAQPETRFCFEFRMR